MKPVTTEQRSPAPGVAIRVLVTLCLMVFTIGVPILEINATHLVNPTWPPHARLHEAWQLATNSALGVLAMFWTWRGQRFALACLIGAVVSGSFLQAWALRLSYGGSMAGTTSAAHGLGGLDSAVVIMVVILMVFAIAGIRFRRSDG